jgi:anti-sigma-K factor RskA
MTNEAQSHEVQLDDLTLFAMGAMEGAEHARIAAHVANCASCRLEWQRINGDMAVLAMAGSPDAAPSDGVKRRLISGIVANKSKSRSLWKWSFAVSALAGCVLFAVAISQWRVTRELREANARLQQDLVAQQKESEEAKMIAETMQAPDAMRVALASTAHPQPQAHTVYSRSKACVFLMAGNLQPLAPGMMYELWLLPMSGGKPVPAGMFKPDSRGNAQMLHMGLPSGMEAKGFAVTVEPAQGSSAPTGTPVLQGVES